ncbi:MAG: hypothetical protein ACFFFC_00910 [Candidatus Thorarchaeota archaeon]
MEKVSTSISNNSVKYDPQYDIFLSGLRSHFNDCIEVNPLLFTTNATDLFQMFLDGLPEKERQHHNCRTCRQFVETYGNLVTIGGTTGMINPIMWRFPKVNLYIESFKRIREYVSKSKVTGIFVSANSEWGTPCNSSEKSPVGEFHHMSVTPPASIVFKNCLLTPEQKMAEKREEYSMLIRSLKQFSMEDAMQAERILASETLYRDEKCLEGARWFHSVTKIFRSEYSHVRNNLIWRKVAEAPPGFCHVKNTMVGTLLQDIKDGLSFETIKRRFDEKMHPLKYQRPQVPPKEGNIKQAEKVVKHSGSSKALERRFARLEEIQTIWTPKVTKVQKQDNSVFGHLTSKNKNKSSKSIELPTVTMTWEKFSRAVLPIADQIEFYVPYERRSYIALITAVHPDAPPILQWDTEKCRNPVNWYVYNGGSFPQAWNLGFNKYVKVNAVTYLPCMWNNPEKYEYQGKGVIFILDGCRDTRGGCSLALFPETLKSQYREIRATIEAHSKSYKPEGSEEATACGIDLRKGIPWGFTFRVTAMEQKSIYLLDRWD